MNDHFPATFAVEHRDFRPEALLQTLFHVKKRRPPQLFCVAFSDDYARGKNFLRVAHGKISSDDEMSDAQLFSGTREAQDDFRMAGGQLIAFDQLLDFNRKI